MAAVPIQRGSVLTPASPVAPSGTSLQYGDSVSFSNDGLILAVGNRRGPDGALDAKGCVYIYDRSGSAWVQRGTPLFAPDATLDDQFGQSVALSSDGAILVVGANWWEGSLADQGGVYTFDWNGSAWVQRGSVLEASDAALGDEFGVSIALSDTGDVLAVGTIWWEGAAANQGGVYIYDRSGSAWVQRGSVLVASDAVTYDQFGQSVALSGAGTVLAVGAYGWEGPVSNQGGVYTFDWNGSAWVERSPVLVASDAAVADLFGTSVALSTDATILAVGASYRDGVAAETGGVYLFDWNGSAWVQRSPVLVASDAELDDQFGSSVALSGNGGVLAVGALRWDATLTDQGGVYIYDVVDLLTSPQGTLAATPSLAGALTGALDNNITESLTAGDVFAASAVGEVLSTDAVGVASTFAGSFASHLADTTAAAESLESTTFTMYLEAIGLADSLAAGANTTGNLTDSAVMRDVVQQAINQIVTDTANGADSLNLGAALALVDIAAAVDTQAPLYNSVMLVAELIASLEAYNGADGYDVTETGTLSDTYVARVQAIFAMLDTAQAVDTNTAMVHVMQLAADSADSMVEITSSGSLINALLNDAVLATIRLNIGGELFTGWVLNADTLAPSEYQFADLQFNSACKHGGTYLLAADDGIYQFTEEAGVETVMTYIKTGKMDFGSDLRKRIVNSYIVYAASGDMTLKVTTSEFGNLVTRNYRVAARVDDTTDVRRVDIGRGIKSRYWQFEMVGDGVDCDIDEIGMLPVVLSRRI